MGRVKCWWRSRHAWQTARIREVSLRVMWCPVCHKTTWIEDE